MRLLLGLTLIAYSWSTPPPPPVGDAAAPQNCSAPPPNSEPEAPPPLVATDAAGLPLGASPRKPKAQAEHDALAARVAREGGGAAVSVSALDCKTCYAPTAVAWDLELTAPERRHAVPELDAAGLRCAVAAAVAAESNGGGGEDGGAPSPLWPLLELIASETPVLLRGAVPAAPAARLANASEDTRVTHPAVVAALPDLSAAGLDWRLSTHWGCKSDRYDTADCGAHRGARPHTDGRGCAPLFHVLVSGAKRWAFHTHHNTTATRGFVHRVGAGFVSDTVYTTVTRPGDVLVFFNQLMPHAIWYPRRKSHMFVSRCSWPPHAA